MIEWVVRRKYFRNANHAIWFLCSAVIFALVMLSVMSPKPRTWLLLLLPASLHVSPLIYSLRLRNKENEVYSQDCIWYNAVMLLVYIAVFIYLR